MMMGDNSPRSSDSRAWAQEDDRELGPDDRLLLGSAAAIS